ncbi:MAG TPA: bifunctional methylenetetrahydrofolate dehydrogenase/methenyltetrahydrofolate cyclohydrolase FolD [Candidatus Limadaptatus stercoravium]|nr:bifunctional methylenetetrahydrofolate dehydrogenase/methenyltetrahydrofolate cyclohydrolase FolD [Candidatus Limadaptatus stercoravium]
MQIIDGKLVAKLTRENIARQVQALPQDKLGKIGLAVILVGDDPASKVYVRNKINGCAEVGIASTLEAMSADSTFEEVAAKIEQFNADPEISGILLQLPVPKHLDEAALLHLIDPSKDVDGCHYVQKGKLWTGEPELIPCTPYGVMKLLDHYSIPLEGKNAVVVGRSNLVGKPLAQLLLDRNATVTVCHSRTRDLGSITSRADIVCVAIGKAKFLKADMVKEGAVVIDVGMDRDENGKLCGDVDFAEVAPKCSYITPVPGGVGPMTVTMLLQNTVTAYKLSRGIE